MTEKTSSEKTRWRYTRLGSVVCSYDFFIGVPIGLATAVAVGFASNGAAVTPGLLIGTAAVCAAIATLVMTSLTVLLTTVSGQYRAFLRQLPEGIAGITYPYRLVVKVGAVGALCSLIGSFLSSVPGGLSLGGFEAGIAVAAAPALALTGWAILGCIQITEQFVEHWTNDDKVMQLEERRQRATSRNAS